MIDSVGGRCNPDNRCKMTGCSYCKLNNDNEEECAVCEASHIKIYPYDRCVREDGT